MPQLLELFVKIVRRYDVANKPDLLLCVFIAPCFLNRFLALFHQLLLELICLLTLELIHLRFFSLLLSDLVPREVAIGVVLPSRRRLLPFWSHASFLERSLLQLLRTLVSN